MQSELPPEVPPILTGSGIYPRQSLPTRISTSGRLLRGFVIANYWLAVGMGIPVLIAGIVYNVGNPSDRSSSRGFDPMTLVLYTPFVIGFLLGWLRARPKRLSAILAGLAGFTSGFFWVFLAARNADPGSILVVMLIYTIFVVTSAMAFNRALQPNSTDIGG